MNRNRFIAIILSIFLIAGCQIFTPIPEPATHSFVLVSDVDDTVKITNVLHSNEKVKNALASELVFAGMPKLYRYILGENSPDGRLRFLSGSPFILEYNVTELLNHAHFPAYKLTLRCMTELNSSALDYKKKRLQEMYGESGDNFILVGDDTESDPAVYNDFSVSKPNRVLAIYIHKIEGKEGKKLPVGSVFFVTAYDIAMHEFKAHRLSEEQAADVGNAVLDSEDATFLPGFQWCSKDPKEYEQIAGLSETLMQLKKKIEDRIITLCSSRRG